MKCYKKDYPRPQFVRDNWENLNGSWDFAFDDKNCGEKEAWHKQFPAQTKIVVPFTYETALSGIGDETRHDVVWYRRTITADLSKLQDNRYMLHFEGSDFLTKVWVNGGYAGCHTGGYARFSMDVTEFLHDGENELVVRAEDSFNLEQPRGKQRWMDNNFACWYVQTTGIWKTVWSEYVPKGHIERVKMTPNTQKQQLEVEYEVAIPEAQMNGDVCVAATVSYQGRLINRSVTAVTSSCVHAALDLFVPDRGGSEWMTLHYWSPEEPELYDVEFQLMQGSSCMDEIGSYFALREIRIEGSNILLNGRPLYQRLILDQGYWKDSHLTPPSEEALIEDIDKIHALGYNGLRKHQKIEDERFLYWCDVKGMLVWSEMAATYRYNDRAVAEMTREWLEIIQQNYNHPCIITWTPINESWGVPQVETDRTQQHFTEMLYHLTKSLDAMRPVVVNDGWEHTVSDIITLHDYEEVGETLYKRYTEFKDELLSTEVYHCNHKSAIANGFAYKGQPVLISEFGGIAFNNDDAGWGYGNKVNTEADFLKRFDEITTAVKMIPYCCGFCYTQVTDVQQEINGLMDMDRQFKIAPEKIREINERKVGYWRSYM